MATFSDYQRLRDDVGATEDALPNHMAALIYEEAAEAYTAAGAAQNAQARIIAIRRLLASSARLTTYRQNQSSENQSDVFKHLQELLKFWQGELAAANAANPALGAARFGGTLRKPQRIKAYPDER
jgi:hypothetical protein